MKITQIKAREVLDSRGNPTVEAEVFTDKFSARAIVPSGASTGIHEALELRDKQKRYLGMGVLKAIENIKKIEKKIKGLDVDDQVNIDKAMIELDGTKNKSRLGANAILAVSMAVCRAGAFGNNMALYEYIAEFSGNKKNILPIPFCNIINGGRHAGSNLKFQEFMVVPAKAGSFHKATECASEIFHVLKEIIGKRYGKISVNVGDEGGFAPNIENAEEALQLIHDAINKAGYKNKAMVAMDAAASEFYKKGIYLGKWEYHELEDYYKKLIKSYKIVSIEDPFAQDDFAAWQEFMRKAKIQVVGDDLLVTNPERIDIAVKHKLCNSLLLKVNQIGTLSEAIVAAKKAQKAKWKVMVSHRSGETEDSFIADLAVGLGTGQIKIGAPDRGERTAKYNQLLRIEEELGRKVGYGGL